MSPENGFKLVMPSPTMLTRKRIQNATAAGVDILLTGVTMGGGPSHWAAEDHIRAGYNVFATPAAARSFNDDLTLLQDQMGLKIVSDDEASRMQGVKVIELRDFDYAAISSAFQAFNVKLDPAAIGIAVFDHGEAPPEISDRKFRFDFLEAQLGKDHRLTALAFLSEEVPDILTRMQAVAASVDVDCTLVLMDTAPAAILGALQDPIVSGRSRQIVVNVGNFHTLAFRLHDQLVGGLFEHHTGLLEQPHLESLLLALASGELQRAQVFAENGHGALIFDPDNMPLDDPQFGIVVTGPRRAILDGSNLRPYFAVPHGDMMLTGCFGLLSAIAGKVPQLHAEISATLAGEYNTITPWDAEA